MSAFQGLGNVDPMGTFGTQLNARRAARQQALSGAMNSSNPYMAISYGAKNKSIGSKIGGALSDAVDAYGSPEFQKQTKLKQISDEVQQWADDNGLDFEDDKVEVLKYSSKILRDNNLGAEAGKFDAEVERLGDRSASAASAKAKGAREDREITIKDDANKIKERKNEILAASQADTAKKTAAYIKAKVAETAHMEYKDLSPLGKLSRDIESAQERGAEDEIKRLQAGYQSLITKNTKVSGTKDGVKQTKAAIQKLINSNLLSRYSKNVDLPGLDSEVHVASVVAEDTSVAAYLMSTQSMTQAQAENAVYEARKADKPLTIEGITGGSVGGNVTTYDAQGNRI